MRTVRWMVLGVSLAVAGAGCDSEKAPPAFEHDRQASVRSAELEDGKASYEMYCAGCHGANGDGRGEAAKFMTPTPRNFQVANYKFSSTRSGLLPTDADLKRSIRKGLKGSAMPPWELLPERTVDALIVYIKTFSPKWQERSASAAIPFVTDPYASKKDKSRAIARGEVVYHGFATCWTCHPSYVSEDKINEHLVAMENPTRDAFRAGLSESEGKPNSEGEMVFPPDFLRDYVRAGASIEDIYRAIAAGITGTAMPTWVDSMEFPAADGKPLVQQADIWALAYYVEDLVRQRPKLLQADALTLRKRTEGIYLTSERPVYTEDAAAGDTEEFEEDEDAEEFIED